MASPRTKSKKYPPVSTGAAVRGAALKEARRPKRRGDRKIERREAILIAALDEFSAQGFAAARLDDVAQRAGVAKGTIYLYFRDKEALFQELVRSALTPVVGSVEALRDADVPIRMLADRMVDLFVNEIFGTKRREVIRLMITEGRRFPKLAEFYHREVLSRVMSAMRELLSRAAARGEVPEALAKFPQLLAAPGLVAVVWTGLFDKYEPLDARAMLRAYFDMLFSLGAKS
jgi:AcrR family transcriptional regulator